MNKNILEWLVFAVSTAVIAGVCAALVYEEVTRGDTPPAFSIEIGSVTETPSGFAVQLTVRNTGDHTAAGVHVELTLDGEQASRTVLEYVPYRSERRVWMSFSRDPRRGRIAARVLGYEEV